MKRLTITATLIAAAVLIIFFIRSSSQKTKPFSITGEWLLDSAYAAYPSIDSIRLSVAMLSHLTDKASYRFNADSSLQYLSAKDSSVEKYYVRDTVLYISEGNGYIPYPLKKLTDSVVEFTTKDSVVYVLKKK